MLSFLRHEIGVTTRHREVDLLGFTAVFSRNLYEMSLEFSRLYQSLKAAMSIFIPLAAVLLAGPAIIALVFYRRGV